MNTPFPNPLLDLPPITFPFSVSVLEVAEDVDEDTELTEDGDVIEDEEDDEPEVED